MRTLFYVLSIVLVVSFVMHSSIQRADAAPISKTYCEGWSDGYCEGWKDVKGQLAICPITPLCPLAKVGRGTYKDGYNRGFLSGRHKAKKDTLKQ